MSHWELTSIYTDDTFAKDLNTAKSLLIPQKTLKETLLNAQEAGKILKELDAFVSCLIAQNTSDPKAHEKQGAIAPLKASYEKALFEIGLQLAALPQKEWETLLNDLQAIAFFVKELRDHAKRKGNKEQEEIINALSTDGYHSLWALYQNYTGKIKIGEKKLSIGQAQNLFSVADRKVRQETLAAWNKTFKEHLDILAQFLNHIAGFRLQVYKTRKWDEILREPLFLNRMEHPTLAALWQAAEEMIPHLHRYLKKKATLLGVEKLSWIDLEAPLGTSPKIPYSEGCQLILDQFEKFHPKMAAFAKKAIDEHWIESEDRPGKAAGGFCTSLPKKGVSRIFMTYSGTLVNVATLAHELGHAYHNECVKHLPFFHQEMGLNVAETASTFAEMIVIDQMIRQAKTTEEKKKLLDDKLQRTVAFLMNLHSRFLFETSFYEERKKGFVSPDTLSTLMTEAQKKAYGNILADWDPYFWAWKLHFFFTDIPFYNFPYTFGYLLSNGLYARAKEGHFGEKFDAFLADTAQMSSEDLCQKHLNVDLTKPDFWRSSAQLFIEDIDTFVSL